MDEAFEIKLFQAVHDWCGVHRYMLNYETCYGLDMECEVIALIKEQIKAYKEHT